MEMWDFQNAADRVKVREKLISDKPYIFMGACLDRWQTGLRRDKRCEVEDKVLLSFVMELERNPVGPRAPHSVSGIRCEA